DHLDAVVLDGIVTARDVGTPVELPVRGGEVEDGRGRLADVHHVDAGRPYARHEAALELAGRLAVVLAHGDGAPAAPADERGVGATHLLEHVRVDVGAHAPADVIGAEDVRVQHAVGPLGTVARSARV